MKAIVGGAILCAALVPLAAAVDRQTVPFDPARASRMRAHYGQVLDVHAAVIRGDLPAVAAAARTVADADYQTSIPAGGARHVAELQDAARLAADAKDVVGAAYATAKMLNACGTCHRAVGTMPALPQTSRRQLGGVVGHMLQHQEAADQMLQGLVIPSSTLWRAGTKAFASAPLHPEDLPASAEARREMMAVEEAIHRLALNAFQATDSMSRVSFYSQMLSGCAECHKRRAQVRGPKE